MHVPKQLVHAWPSRPQEEGAPEAPARPAAPDPGRCRRGMPRGPGCGYGVAIVATSAVLWARVAAQDWAGDRLVLIAFLLPILLSVHVGGLGPGLVATALAALGANYYLIPPAGSFAFERPADLLQWFLLVALGGLASFLFRSEARPGGAAAPADPGTVGRAERKVHWGFALAILILVITGGLGQMSLGWMTRDSRTATETIQFVGQLNRVLVMTIDAETAQRGYVLTGDARYLAPYENVMGRVETEIASLRGLAERHPDQQAGVEELVGLVRERLAEVGRTIEVRRSVGLGASVDQIVGGDGAALQDRIRRAVERLEEMENAAFRGSAADSAASARLAMRVLAGTTIIAIALVAVGLYLIGVDFAGSRRAAQHLREAQVLLERRVEERTAQLARVNAELQESELRFRQLVESLPQLVWSCEPDGSCAYLSPQWVAYTGIPMAEQLGFGWKDRIHPEDRDRVVSSWRATAPTGSVFTMEYRLRRHDGAYRWFDVRGLPLRDREGRVVKWFGTHTDVTERHLGERRALAQLAVSRILARAPTLKEAAPELLATLVESEEWDAGGIWEIDPSAATLRCSAYWARPGLDDRALRERTLRIDFPRGVGLPGRIWASGEAQLIADIGRDGGYLRAAEASAAGLRCALGFPILVEGEVAGVVDFLATAIPASDEHLRGMFETYGRQIGSFLQRRRAENALHDLNADLERRVAERTAQWETANRELEAFSYSVSHDLRAPLRTVDGFAQALAEDYGAQLPPGGMELIRTIRNGAGKMAELIDDLLTFSRLSRAPMRRDRIDTAELVRDVAGALEGTHAGREVVLEIGALPPCEGDLALIRQVWLNLLSNAIKYTGRRARAEIAVAAQANAGETVFLVRDNGAGFDMKYAHKLFGVFQRLHRAEDYEGTGVGLAIVHRIVSRHGGRVWAEAAPDRGATFYFTLGIPTES